MLFSIEQSDADLAAVFSKWYTGTTEHRMHHDSANTKISANSGVDQGCSLSTSGFSAAIDPHILVSMSRHFQTVRHRCQAFCLPARLVSVDQTSVLATNICTHHSCNQISQHSSFSHPRSRSGGSPARTRFLLSCKTRSDSHSELFGRAPTNPR